MSNRLVMLKNLSGKLTDRLALTIISLSAGFLSGCAGFNLLPEKPSVVEVSDPVIENKDHSKTEKAVNSKRAVIDRLLHDAQTALSRDQLTTPAHTNAFDKYKAVLLFDKNNVEALLGIGKIVSRYCELARSSATQGQFGQAKLFLSKAIAIEPNLSEIAKTREFIAHKQQNFTDLVTLQNPVEKKSQNEIALSRQQLSNRSDILAQQLQTIALEVRAADHYVLIIAPTDSDGRWVYQEMKKAVPGYRLRGDIRRGRTPKIVFQDPLE